MFLTILAVIALAASQVDHTPIVPIVHAVRMQPKVETVPSQHTFSHTFGSLGYQISGRVYETNIGLLDDQLFQSQFYRPSNSCYFYNSQLSVEAIADSPLDDELSVQASAVADEASKAFILVSDTDYLIDHNQSKKVILTYHFTSDGAVKSSQNISVADLGLKEDSEIDIQLFAKGSLLLVTDGVKIVGIDIKKDERWAITIDENGDNVKVDYQFARLNDLLLMTIVEKEEQGPQLIILWNQVAKIYQFSADFKTATFTKELKPPTGKQFTSGVFQESYFLLIQGQLVIYRDSSNPDYITLESLDCWGINKFESTIHAICRESGASYVAEYYYNSSFEKVSQALKLNRYYTDIDDVRVISRFGSALNPKLLISGDYDLMLTAYGINRQILIQSNQRQAANRYKSFGLQKVITVKALTTPNSTYAIGVGTRFLIFFRINEQPAQIECTLQRKQSMIRWNILVEINTTSCARNSQIEQLQSICQYNIPFTYYVSLFEVDSEKQTTVHVFASVVLLACALLMLGCAFHCKAVRTKAINEIQKKIEAIKNRKKPKPI